MIPFRAVFWRALTLVCACLSFGFVMGLRSAHADDSNAAALAAIQLIPEPYRTYVVTVLSIIGACAALSAYLPKSASPTSAWGLIRSILDFCGHNFLNAKNAGTPAPNASKSGIAFHSVLAGIVIIGAVLVLASCASSPTLSVVCKADANAPAAVQAAGQITVDLDPSASSQVALANAVDQLVHPLVTQACAQALPGSTPVQVAPTPVS